MSTVAPPICLAFLQRGERPGIMVGRDVRDEMFGFFGAQLAEQAGQRSETGYLITA